MILYKDGVTHDDVAERSDGNWDQSVPGGEKVKEEGVEDNQTVDSSSLLSQDADPGQQVDYKGDQGDGNVCKKVRPCLCNDHLD